MSREIKFRAWDIRNNEMIKHDFVILGANGRVYISDEKNSGDYITLLQFTGLHDKNGKEIWEGDVCNVTMNKDKNEAIDYDMGQCTVIWGNGGLFLEGYSNDLGWQCNNLDVEVIGNIYESPELLNKTK